MWRVNVRSAEARESIVEATVRLQVRPSGQSPVERWDISVQRRVLAAAQALVQQLVSLVVQSVSPLERQLAALPAQSWVL